MSNYFSGLNKGPLGESLNRAPVVRFMLYSNIAVYLFQLLFGSLRLGNFEFNEVISRYGALFPLGSALFQPWQLITYMFLHGDFWHIFVNMLLLFFCGPVLEDMWGSKKFLIYYLLCGIGGGLAHILLGPLFGPAGPLIGASGAIFGLIVAIGLLFPNQTFYFYFLFPIKAKYLVIFYLIREVLSISANDNIGHLAHLGGAAIGMVYLVISSGGFSALRGSSFGSSRGSGWKFPKQPFGSTRRNMENEMVEAEYEEIGSSRMTGNRAAPGHRVITQEDIDRILDKIAASGYQNLTEEERQILFEASRKMDGQ